MLEGNETFDKFLSELSDLIDAHRDDEATTLREGRKLVAELVSDGNWLPEKYKMADERTFRQYLLYRDKELRFSVLSVVWAPGQYATPHDHTIWGIVGQLQGAEHARDFYPHEPGQPLKIKVETTLHPGDTAVIAPSAGDIHDVRNVSDGVSVSIHVYGGDLASVASRRHRYKEDSGETEPFVASYH